MKIVREHISESIKHLPGRTQEEIEAIMKNLPPQEKLETGARHGMAWLVKDAIVAGADVHAYDDLALRWASGNGHIEVVKVLLDAGADVHARDDYALRWASGNGHVEIVKLLKQYRAKHRSVNESIKHLPGRTEQEIRQNLKNASPADKLETGLLMKDLSLIKQATKEGVDFTAYITSNFLYPLSYAIIYNAGDDIIDFICKHTHNIELLRVGLNWARQENNKKWEKILRRRIYHKEKEKWGKILHKEKE